MERSQNHASLWQDLDALVLAEVEALEPATAPVQQPTTSAAAAAPAEIDADDGPRDLQMFDGEEQEVIARTSAWLRDRPNRDMIIDALWSAVADLNEDVAAVRNVPEEAAEPLTEQA